ncbi:MAG: ring-cleaving dioxygenase [Balneolales bacterium]
MSERIKGIHHITAISGDPQRNLEFYSGILGMRLVKKTVNFDDPGTYHLYYGDESGNPGTLLTFFPWMGMPAGEPGGGEATAIAFAIPPKSFDYWMKRFDHFKIQYESPVKRMDGNEKALVCKDPDGISLELVEVAGLESKQAWEGSPVPVDYAIRNFHSVSLTIEELGPTSELFTQTLGFRAAGEDEKRKRFESGVGGPSTYVDLIYDSMVKPGRMGRGSIHHVAFRVDDKESQLLMREQLNAYRLKVTPVIDRDYFLSIYFREPGGVLLEVATDTPGFTTDESLESLGRELRLPKQHQPQEVHIREILPELKIPDIEKYRV